MSVPMKPWDPAYWMLSDTKNATKPVIFRKGCYICEDPEFAMMGLPLCYICKYCGGHVPADGSFCDSCIKDNHPERD